MRDQTVDSLLKALSCDVVFEAWVQEPPYVLLGGEYAVSDTVSLIVIVSSVEHQPKVSWDLKWDYSLFLKERVRKICLRARPKHGKAGTECY